MSNVLIIHDSPIRLVFKIITVSLIFSLIYLIIALMSGHYPSFDDGTFLTFITYDILTFVFIIVLQQCITLLLLLQWIKRYYSIDSEGITLTEGVFLRKQNTIPVGQIRTISQHQNWLGQRLHYGTISIELINRPTAIVIPYLAHPEQVIAHLHIRDNQPT